MPRPSRQIKISSSYPKNFSSLLEQFHLDNQSYMDFDSELAQVEAVARLAETDLKVEVTEAGFGIEIVLTVEKPGMAAADLATDPAKIVVEADYFVVDNLTHQSLNLVAEVAENSHVENLDLVFDLDPDLAAYYL